MAFPRYAILADAVVIWLGGTPHRQTVRLPDCLNVGLNFGYLAWSHDSAYVYFDTFLSSDSGYFRVSQ